MYLDQNHFVNMARVSDGQSIPGYAELLEACRESRAENRAVFPLSLTHLLETGAISLHARRAAIAKVMEELSGFNYLLGREAIQLLEIEETVRARGIDLPHAGGADLLGRGGMHP